MSLYQKYILPRLIDAVMRREKNKKQREELVPKASGVVLDVGFGSGLNLPFYRAGVSKLYALDPSKELWRFAQGRINKISFPVEFINASAEKIPLSDNSIDTAVMTWTLCSVFNPKQTLKEIHRVLKTNGKLIFIEHGLSSQKIISKLQTFFNPTWARISGGCNLNRKVDNLIINANFKILELEKDDNKAILGCQYKGVANVIK